MKKAVILCSGGLDSVVSAYYVKKKLGYEDITLLFFNYFQKSLLNERKSALRCSKALNAKFKEIKLPELAKLSTSLINKKGRVKKISRKDLKDTEKESAKWYVPCRNQIFLSYALAFAEQLFIKEKLKSDLFLGFKCEGRESYPDTTKDFIDKMNALSKISTLGKFTIFSPLIEKDKEDIIQLGIKLGVNLKDTFSCYLGKQNHCGYCLACRLRQEGFYWAGIKDLTKYNNA